MFYLQKAYSLVLNPIYRITCRIPEKLRNLLITICCLFLAGFFIAYYDIANRETLYLQHGKNNLICGIALVIIIICSIKTPLRKVRWEPALFWLFFISGLGLVVIRCIHPIGDGYRSFGLMMMFIFPCLYYVWNNRGDYNTLYIRLAGATSAVGLAYYVKVVCLALIGELAEESFRVRATFYNANLFSMVGMSMVCAALYMFMVKRDSIRWFFFAVFSFGAGWSIVRMGVSRLSVLVCLGGMLAFSIFWFKTKNTFSRARSPKVQFIRFGCTIIVAILFMFNGEILLDINTAMQFRQNSEVSAEQGAMDTTGEIEESAVQDEEAAHHDITSASERFNTERKDLNSYSAGRIVLWQRYAQHLNILGHDMKTTDFKELTGSTVQHAHNNFLEYAYRCGVPVALIHILLELYAGIICIIFLFNRKYKDPAYLFAVVFMICYAVESMFDIATVPFERHAPFYFYMALIPVFGRQNDMKRTD